MSTQRLASVQVLFRRGAQTRSRVARGLRDRHDEVSAEQAVGSRRFGAAADAGTSSQTPRRERASLHLTHALKIRGILRVGAGQRLDVRNASSSARRDTQLIPTRARCSRPASRREAWCRRLRSGECSVGWSSASHFNILVGARERSGQDPPERSRPSCPEDRRPAPLAGISYPVRGGVGTSPPR